MLRRSEDLAVTASDDIQSDVTVVTNLNGFQSSEIGTYTIIYTATDVAGYSDTKYRTVVVVDNTPPDISFSKNPHTINLTKDLSIQEYTNMIGVSASDSQWKYRCFNCTK